MLEHFPAEYRQSSTVSIGRLYTFLRTGQNAFHAFGVTLKNGVEVLIHIGIDTVKENGNGFKLFAKTQGSNVKAGEPIVEVDFGQLRRKYDMTVMLVVTNAANNPIVFLKPGSVKKGQAIIES
jgi:Phosphotransferase system IIA components